MDFDKILARAKMHLNMQKEEDLHESSGNLYSKLASNWFLKKIINRKSLSVLDQGQIKVPVMKTCMKILPFPICSRSSHFAWNPVNLRQNLVQVKV